MDLLADIGATSSRCALLDDKGRVLSPEVFHNADFAGVEGLLKVYLTHRRATDQPRRAAIAIAAPVLADNVDMLNIDWQLSQAELKQNLALNRLLVVNDFTAIANALPTLGPGDREQVGSGKSITQAPLLVLGPGSGLGVSSLIPTSDGWSAISSEGGHVTAAATTEDEAAAIALIRDKYGHCSAERILSGPGLVELYKALAKLAGRGSPTVTAADVTALTRQSEPLATRTLDMFFALLGSVAGDLALSFGARGGVYIAGGIVPRLIDLLKASPFRERFAAKGRYRAYLETVPTYIITDPLAAFRGLKILLGYR